MFCFSSNYHILQYVDKILTTTRDSYDTANYCEAFVKDEGDTMADISNLNTSFSKRKAYFKNGESFKTTPVTFVCNLGTFFEDTFDDNYGVSTNFLALLERQRKLFSNNFFLLDYACTWDVQSRINFKR